MLKNWSYEMHADPLKEGETATPEYTEVCFFNKKGLKNLKFLFKIFKLQVKRNLENDIIHLQNITEDVVHELSQKIIRHRRNGKREEVNFIFLLPLFVYINLSFFFYSFLKEQFFYL